MSKEIKYSDGDVELDILRALQNAEDVSSNADIAFDIQQINWPFEYHLSQDRTNLIRHLNFDGMRVLEIGAGMGAISRFVAEKCSFLQVVEGTSRRLDCLNERLRGLDNFDVFCGNFKDYNTNQKFDIILIIGVLEYSEIYFPVKNGDNPFIEFLKKANSHLNQDGSIVVAIENRLGIKYWSGASEDHTGGYFDGILGYSTSNSVRTFSKKELKHIFSESGITNIEIQYPFPDYKLPRSVLSDDLAQNFPRVFSNIASSQIGRDYGKTRPILFSDGVAFESLIDTGLASEFSNSFLFISGNKALKNKNESFHYSKFRKDNITTSFRPDEKSLLVTKSLVRDTDNRNSVDYESILWQSSKDVIATNGSQFINILRRNVTFREWVEFESNLYNFFNWILKSYGLSTDHLKGDAWDLIPQNIIVDSHFNFHPIDQEWFLKESFPISLFILRCLLGFDQNMMAIIREKYSSISSLYSLLCNNMLINDVNISRDCVHEIQTQRKISADPTYKQEKDAISHILWFVNYTDTDHYLDTRTHLTTMLRNEKGYAVEKKHLHSTIEMLNNTNYALKHELDEYKSTLLFKVFVLKNMIWKAARKCRSILIKTIKSINKRNM